MAERLFTTYQIAELLQTTPGTVVEWMEKGWLPFKRLPDGPVRIAERQLIEFLKNQGIDLAQIMARVAAGDDGEIEGEYQSDQGQAEQQEARRTLELPSGYTESPGGPAPEAERPAEQAPEEPQPVEQEPTAEEPRPDEPVVESEAAETPAEPEAAEPPADEIEAPGPSAVEAEMPESFTEEAQTAEPAEAAETPSSEDEPAAAQADVAEQSPEPSALPHAPDALVEAILREALGLGAEYVHLDPAGEGYAVLMRSARGLLERPRYRRRLSGPGGRELAEHVKALAGLPADGGRPLLGSFARAVDGRDVEVRLSTCPMLRGEKLLLQVAPSEPVIALGEVGLGRQQLSGVRAAMDVPGGLVIVTSPPRNGRRTTLRAMAADQISENRGILAVEKPPATPLAVIRQIPTAAGGVPFVEAARVAAEMDCDVLLIEDLTEPAVASAALEAAERGAVVVAGMRAADSAAALAELVAMGAGGWSAGRLLRCVIAQRAVRTLCPACRREITVSDDQLAAIGLGEQEGFGAYAPVGCDMCDGSGYAGRTALFALREQSEAMCLALRAEADADAIRGILGASAVELLAGSAVEKLRAGVTSPQEVADALRM